MSPRALSLPIAFLFAFAWAPRAAAYAPEIPVQLGATSSSARSALAMEFENPRWHSASRPQGLGRGLIDTGLLGMLNRFDAAPKDEQGTLDVRAFREIATGDRAGRRYVLAFGGAEEDPRLGFILMTIPTPVDTSKDPEGQGWSPRRLRPLKRAIASFSGFSPAPVERDAHGNARAWRGRAGNRSLILWYLPERDELWALYASR